MLDYIKKSDMLLLTLCLISSIYGIVLISSATSSYGGSNDVTIQALAIVLGIFLFVIFSIIDVEILADRWKWLLAFNVLFISTLFIWGESGDTVNKGWLRFGPIGIQPAEVVKISFIILLAKQMSYLRAYKNLNSISSMIQVVFHFVFIFGLILVSSSDLGSALVYFFIFIFILFTGGVKLRWFAIGAVIIAGAIPLAWKYMLQDYQKNRILAPYDTSVDPTGLGVRWHANQSKIAIAGGQVTGQGLYSGAQSQSDYLPNKHTDFIFSVAGEELGLIGCLAIVFLLTAIIIRCIYVGIKSRDYMSMLVCMGISGMLIFQAFENIGMCLGLTPVVGITLPFFSSGGSSIITLFAAMGIVSGIKMRPKPSRYMRRY